MVISFCPAVILLHFYLHFVPIEFIFIIEVVVVVGVLRVLPEVLIYWLSHVSMDLGDTITIFPLGSRTL